MQISIMNATARVLSCVTLTCHLCGSRIAALVDVETGRHFLRKEYGTFDLGSRSSTSTTFAERIMVCAHVYLCVAVREREKEIKEEELCACMRARVHSYTCCARTGSDSDTFA